MDRFWKASEKIASLVTVLGTLALLILGILALLWAQRTFRQMELDFRFTSPAEHQVLRGSCIVDGVFSGRSGVFAVALDGEVIGHQIPLVLDTTEVSDGTHALSVQIQRDDGTTTKVASTVIEVDNQAPVVSILYPETGQVVGGVVDLAVEIRGAREDTQPTFVLDGRVVEPLDELDTLSLAEGSHTLAIEATDEAGNRGHSVLVFAVDNTPPEITSIGIPEGVSIRGQVVLSPDVVESNAAHVQWKLDGEAISDSWDLVLETHSLTDGEHRLEFTVWDWTGGEVSRRGTLMIDNTPPLLCWALPGPDLSPVYKDQRLPLGIVTDRDADVSVRVNGQSVETAHLYLEGHRVGDPLEVVATAHDLAGNTATLECTLTVSQSLFSRLVSLWTIARALSLSLFPPSGLRDAHARVIRPGFSFEYCPPTTTPFWLGARVGVDLPPVELYAQLVPVPGLGFSIPLQRRAHPESGSTVAMVPKLGFGFMGIVLPLGGDDNTGEEDGASERSMFWQASSAYAEILFSWDLTPVMDRDYTEISLGFRLGLTDVVTWQGEGLRHSYTPAASLVMRVKGFFW